MDSEKPILNIGEACELLGISRYKFKQLVDKGVLKPVAGNSMFRRVDVEMVIGTRDETATPDSDVSLTSTEVA